MDNALLAASHTCCMNTHQHNIHARYFCTSWKVLQDQPCAAQLGEALLACVYVCKHMWRGFEVASAYVLVI